MSHFKLTWHEAFPPPPDVLASHWAEGRYPDWLYTLNKVKLARGRYHWEAWFSDRNAVRPTKYRIAQGSFTQVRKACIDHHNLTGI